MKKALAILLSVAASVSLILTLIFGIVTAVNAAAVNALDEGENIVYIDVKGYGIMTLELYPEEAPITVANFKKLASENFYDGVIFHRVIEHFVVQGGDPLGTGYGGSDTEIKGEFASNGVANSVKHERGTISMARSNKPDSASSQFFIVHETSKNNSLSLDGKYAAFGKVTNGIEIVDAIAAVETNANDKPLKPVVMRTVTQDKDQLAPSPLPVIILGACTLALAAGAVLLFVLHSQELKALAAKQNVRNKRKK